MAYKSRPAPAPVIFNELSKMGAKLGAREEPRIGVRKERRAEAR